MSFERIGVTTARVEFRKLSDPGCYEVKLDCSMNCTCEARLSKAATPDIESARRQVLCFNDGKSQGLSGKNGDVTVIQDGPELWIFEVEAEISEERS